MSSRTARTSLVAFLLVVGAAGGYIVFDTGEQHARALADERGLTARLDAMLASVNELALTQRGYFEPGREGGVSGPLFQRVRQLTEELRTHVAAIRTELATPEAIEQATVLTEALDKVAATDARVRTNLANDTFFSAAELVFSTSTTELRSAIEALIALKHQVMTNTARQQSALRGRALLVTAGVALVWILGLVILVRPAPETPALAAEPAVAGLEPASEPAATPAAASSSPALPPLGSPIDLEGVARVCTAIGGATSVAQLRELLADAASAAGAAGMVIWLGAGEELFPVLGHGYDPRMLSRIGPISRDAENATAVAWRSGDSKVVRADLDRTGAIIVPMLGASGCLGVLSAEVAAGREDDPALRAVVSLFAAQLAAIVAAWPEPTGLGDGSLASRPGTMAVTL